MNFAALISVVIIFVLVFVVVMAGTARFGRKDAVAERLRKITPVGDMGEGKGPTALVEGEETGLAKMLRGFLESTGTDIQKAETELHMKLAQSGIGGPSAVAYYLFMKKFGWAVGGLLALVLLTGDEGGLIKMVSYVLAIFFVSMGIWGADIYLKNRKQKRQYTLQRSFPDALDLILVCVESGLALDAAMARVCRELELAHPEITKEFNKTRMELTLLNDRERALTNLAERTDMVPFRALVSSLLQSEKFGTSLSETLRVLSEDYRNTRLMIAENKAGRLPAMMTIPMMVMLLPALMMILMGPAIISLLSVWSGPP